jgi:hypothetical protein
MARVGAHSAHGESDLYPERLPRLGPLSSCAIEAESLPARQAGAGRGAAGLRVVGVSAAARVSAATSAEAW